MPQIKSGDIEGQVLRFVREQVPNLRPPITLDTSLQDDLRMVWEDADTFLERFFSAFWIDHAGSKFDRYFPTPRYFLISFGRRTKHVPLTVRLLLKADEEGRWTDP